MGIIESLFESLQAIVSNVGSLIGSVFNSATELIYTPGVADAPGQLTVVGVLCLIGVGVGLFFFAFKWIRSLIKIKA